jgi:hypothetical protein
VSAVFNAETFENTERLIEAIAAVPVWNLRILAQADFVAGLRQPAVPETVRAKVEQAWEYYRNDPPVVLQTGLMLALSPQMPLQLEEVILAPGQPAGRELHLIVLRQLDFYWSEHDWDSLLAKLLIWEHHLMLQLQVSDESAAAAEILAHWPAADAVSFPSRFRKFTVRSFLALQYKLLPHRDVLVDCYPHDDLEDLGLYLAKNPARFAQEKTKIELAHFLNRIQRPELIELSYNKLLFKIFEEYIGYEISFVNLTPVRDGYLIEFKYNESLKVFFARQNIDCQLISMPVLCAGDRGIIVRGGSVRAVINQFLNKLATIGIEPAKLSDQSVTNFRYRIEYALRPLLLRKRFRWAIIIALLPAGIIIGYFIWLSLNK